MPSTKDLPTPIGEIADLFPREILEVRRDFVQFLRYGNQGLIELCDNVTQIIDSVNHVAEALVCYLICQNDRLLLGRSLAQIKRLQVARDRRRPRFQARNRRCTVVALVLSFFAIQRMLRPSW